MSLMDLEAALQAFENCLKWDSNHWKSLLKLAKISIMGQSDEDALTFYKKALAVHSNLAEAYEGIGLIHFRNKLFDEAIFWLSRGVLIEPGNRRCLLGLTQTCLLVEEPKIGIETLESMRTIVGDDISIVMALGQLYFIEGKFERGKEMVDLALARTQTKRLAS